MFNTPEFYQMIRDCYAEPDRWKFNGDLFRRQVNGLLKPADAAVLLEELRWAQPDRLFFVHPLRDEAIYGDYKKFRNVCVRCLPII